MENMSIFTRKTNLTRNERACANLVKGTLEMVNCGLLTKAEGSMRIWGAREILGHNEPDSPFYLEMLTIEREMMK